MRIGVTGIGARCAAGDVNALLALLDAGVDAFTATPPYPSEGLVNPACGVVSGLDRERPAEALLADAVQQALDDAGAGSTGAGLVVGTASGGLCGPWERWHRAVLAGRSSDPDGTGRDDPARAIARRLGFTGPVLTVSTACTSGTVALAIAEGWLRDGLCARVVAAGVDALSLFVHAGFSGLGALTATRPRPFRPSRDGLLIGEGAGALVLEPGDAPIALLGVGVAADAVHMTAPDRRAGGAIRAARQALARAGSSVGAIHTVSVHGTGTPFNDAMEQVALDALWGRSVDPFGDAPSLQLVKAAVGHTMGAAGAIEAAAAVAALRRRPGAALSMSSAFGGMNASALFGYGQPAATAPIDAQPLAPIDATADLRAHWPDAPLAARRATPTARAALALVHREIAERGPLPDGSALVLSTRTGCAAVDRAYHERLVAEGAASVSRLAFANTIPAAPICEASVAFQVRGPLICVYGPASCGVDEAARLVRHGLAPEALALDIEGPTADGVVDARAVRVVRVARG